MKNYTTIQNLQLILAENGTNYFNNQDLKTIKNLFLIHPYTAFKKDLKMEIIEIEEDAEQLFFLNDIRDDSLDFLISIESFKYIKNIHLQIYSIAKKIRSNGTFAFSYHKFTGNAVQSGLINFMPRLFPDGIIQRALRSCNFYIQEERELNTSLSNSFQIVLIIAQKKSDNY